MMYDQDGAPTFRQSVLRALALVVVIALLWVLLWLIFFRDSPKDTDLKGAKTGQNQSSDQGDKSKDNPKPSPAPSNGTTANPPGGPSELADTGAGNVLIPFGVATAAGTVLYHIRLRRKLKA